ncbi:MAG: pilus assembly protein [Ruminiclostridium sp.]|nr:pilus assembly protein [Ruminiclostridium sp.]
MNRLADRTKHIKEKLNNEDGLVLVEAAIVFPIMFFVLLFILFMGNIYYEQARIDDITLKYAVKGAQYIADPQLMDMADDGSVKVKSDDVDVQPYRYLFGPLGGGIITSVEDTISTEVKNEMTKSGLKLLGGSEVNVIGTDNSKVAKFNSYVVYSTFIVQVNYQVKLPIRLLGGALPTVATLSSRAEVSVNDSPEFIRNVDMVVDLLDGSKAAENIKGFFDKINGFITGFANK